MDKEAYKNLIPIKNFTKEKYMAYLDAVLTHGANLGTMVETMSDAFDLENAAGDQLDMIGALVGIDRLLAYVPATGTREMDDDEYRLAIKMKIGRNVWDGTNEAAIELYSQLFSGTVSIVYEDNQDMSVSFSIYGSVSAREAEILNATGVLLVPAGVSHVVATVSGEANISVCVGAAVTGVEIYQKVTVY